MDAWEASFMFILFFCIVCCDAENMCNCDHDANCTCNCYYTPMIVLTAVASLLLLLVICLTVCCCIYRKKYKVLRDKHQKRNLVRRYPKSLSKQNDDTQMLLQNGVWSTEADNLNEFPKYQTLPWYRPRDTVLVPPAPYSKSVKHFFRIKP